MITMLNRMCWNSKAWLLPTHSSDDGGYTRENGFGHEEWNFQLSDAVDDYVYGYLYYRPNEAKIREAGGHFRILFWSMHPQTHDELVVGSYEDAVVPSVEDYQRVDIFFRENGIYTRRATELASEVKSLTYERALSEVVSAIQLKYLSFKCPVEAIIHLENYLLIEDLFPDLKLGRYFRNPTFLDKEDVTIPTLASGRRRNQLLRRPSAPAEDGYYRETSAKLEMIIPQHNLLSNRFCKWLIARGYEDVIQEANYVDITFTKRGVTYLAELKICYGAGTTRAIREALGQLLEYNFYPGRKQTGKWLIVLDQKPSKEDVEYIELLNTHFAFKLSLLWAQPRGFEIASTGQL